MNAIVERLEPARKVKPPLELQIVALRREVRALKKELKAERAHTVDMLAIMRRMTGGRASALLPVREYAACRCTPTRSEMLRR